MPDTLPEALETGLAKLITDDYEEQRPQLLTEPQDKIESELAVHNDAWWKICGGGFINDNPIIQEGGSKNEEEENIEVGSDSEVEGEGERRDVGLHDGSDIEQEKETAGESFAPTRRLIRAQVKKPVEESAPGEPSEQYNSTNGNWETLPGEDPKKMILNFCGYRVLGADDDWKWKHTILGLKVPLATAQNDSPGDFQSPSLNLKTEIATGVSPEDNTPGGSSRPEQPEDEAIIPSASANFSDDTSPAEGPSPLAQPEHQTAVPSTPANVSNNTRTVDTIDPLAIPENDAVIPSTPPNIPNKTPAINTASSSSLSSIDSSAPTPSEPSSSSSGSNKRSRNSSAYDSTTPSNKSAKRARQSRPAPEQGGSSDDSQEIESSQEDKSTMKNNPEGQESIRDGSKDANALALQEELDEAFPE
ncbi:uncharacterized protein PAC_06992 [Phialocephala subalpina]|uniref:Uncharacterized protein n=1 Tax=Phialocephala subalpina TaxID=576137 RepID=A0A1L7WWI0_9HELO|nr:uncharacterized protein PAC_06992 [Phialocephala subalpina]